MTELRSPTGEGLRDTRRRLGHAFNERATTYRGLETLALIAILVMVIVDAGSWAFVGAAACYGYASAAKDRCRALAVSTLLELWP